MVTATVNTYYVVKAIHTMSVLLTFGLAFVYPLVVVLARRRDPRSLPALHRIEYTVERTLIVPGLLVVVLTGIDATSIAHHWGQFFVGWGLGVAILIGVLVTAVMIPSAERAAALAERDLKGSGEGAGAGAGAALLSEEYDALARRLLILGLLLSSLVLITTLFMAVAFNP